jgi:L-fucose isomerase-like protein
MAGMAKNSQMPAVNKNSGKTKIQVVLAHPSSKEPCWPNIGYDFEANKTEFMKNLEKYCPDVAFLPVTAGKDEDATQILQSGAEADGYIVYLSGCLWGNVPETIAGAGKPTVLVDNLYAGSGEFLTSYARVRREGLPVAAVSSSDFQDVAEAVRALDTLKKLKDSAVLVVGGKPDKKIEEFFGTRMVAITFPEINEAYSKADKASAQKWADQWTRGAAKIIEPTQSDIVKSAILYVAMMDLMKKHQAQAIAVNCLGGFYGGYMPAYPCLGFMQLNNDGLVGACEADQRSTITMLLMNYLVGRPGFISDPVIDTAKNQIIYAHCVAPTKVFGPDGPSNPYHIRSHSEDRKGACDRSLMPLGEMTTTIEFDAGKKQVIFHQGKTVENVDLDLACRNKLAVEVQGDVYKLLNYWDEWGWHRVTFYGDFKRQIYQVAQLLQFEVVEEA